MSFISNNCEKIFILIQTLFIGLLTIFGGYIIIDSPITNNIASIILISIGCGIILFGIYFVRNMPKIKNRHEYQPVHTFEHII